MAKKVILLISAVAVLAFAVPANAAAATEVTQSAGVTAKVGTAFTATGSDFIVTSDLLGEITCEKLNFTGKLTTNDGTEFAGVGDGGFTTSNCFNGKNSVSVTKFEVMNLTSKETGSVVMSFVTTMDIGTLSCTFTGANVPGKYTFGSNTITFSSASGIKGSSGCGTANLDTSFAIEISGTSVILD